MESERRTPDNTDEGRFQNRPISGFSEFSRFRLEVNWPGRPVGGSRKRMLRICLERNGLLKLQFCMESHQIALE